MSRLERLARPRLFSQGPRDHGDGDERGIGRAQSPRGGIGRSSGGQYVIDEQDATPPESGTRSTPNVKRALQIRAPPGWRQFGLFIGPSTLGQYMGRQPDPQSAGKNGRERLWGMRRPLPILSPMMGNGDHDFSARLPKRCFFELPQAIGQGRGQLLRARFFRRQAHVAKVGMVIAQSDDRLEMESISPAVNAVAARVDVRTHRRPAPPTAVAKLGRDRVLAHAAQVGPDAHQSSPGLVFTSAERTPRRRDQTDRGPNPAIDALQEARRIVRARSEFHPFGDCARRRNPGWPEKFHLPLGRINSVACAELSYSSGRESADE
jgi:hypothetical protein